MTKKLKEQILAEIAKAVVPEEYGIDLVQLNLIDGVWSVDTLYYNNPEGNCLRIRNGEIVGHDQFSDGTAVRYDLDENVIHTYKLFYSKSNGRVTSIERDDGVVYLTDTTGREEIEKLKAEIFLFADKPDGRLSVYIFGWRYTESWFRDVYVYGMGYPEEPM